MTTAYWWQGSDALGYVPNLGDLLTPILLRQLANLSVTWEPPTQADLVCCGSVLDSLPRSGWAGGVIGAGQLQATTTTDLTHATVFGVRGPLTLQRIHSSQSEITIGDPGLLASYLAPASQRYEVGIVAHWSDRRLVSEELALAVRCGYPARVIDIGAEPLETIATIGSCRKIVASALHGVIVADAFGIPRRAEPFPSMNTNPWEGASFKWLDYGTSIGQPIEFGKLQQAPTGCVQEIQHNLLAMFQRVKENYAAT
jgi:pyruvyltransferase